MKISNFERKLFTKELFDLFEKEDVTAHVFNGKDDKPKFVLLRADVFSDLKTENESMKQWLFLATKDIFALSNEDGTLNLTQENVQRLQLLAADGLARFLGYDPKENYDA